jgi:ribosome-binding protein aMBF1 (putative translation factor)
MAKCPICGKEYEDRPAISRKDNKTEICPDCGTLEALESIGASDEMKDEVLKKIHEARKGAGV